MGGCEISRQCAFVSNAALPSLSSTAVRATSTAIRLAIDVPVTKIRWPLWENQRWARPLDDLIFDLKWDMVAPQLAFSPAASISASMPTECRHHEPIHEARVRTLPVA